LGKICYLVTCVGCATIQQQPVRQPPCQQRMAPPQPRPVQPAYQPTPPPQAVHQPYVNSPIPQTPKSPCELPAVQMPNWSCECKTNNKVLCNQSHTRGCEDNGKMYELGEISGQFSSR